MRPDRMSCGRCGGWQGKWNKRKERILIVLQIFLRCCQDTFFVVGGHYPIHSGSLERTIQKTMEKLTKMKYFFRVFTTNRYKRLNDKTKTI